MIKALSNKPRENFQDDKQKDCSTVSSFLPNDLEKSNGSNVFDMEKYLKKTEVSGHEGGLENFSKTGVSRIWDLSLPKEQTIQEISTVHLDAADISARQPEDVVVTLPGASEQRENQVSLKTIDPFSQVNTRENESTKVDGKMYSMDNRLPSTGTGEKANASLSAPASNSHSLERSTRIATLWLCEELQDNNGEKQQQNEYVNEISNSEKRVAFEKQSILSHEIVGMYQRN